MHGLVNVMYSIKSCFSELVIKALSLICDALKSFFSHYQICICVVKLETCPMRAIIAATVASRAV